MVQAVSHRLFTMSHTHAVCRDGWEKSVCHRCTYHLSSVCFTVTIIFSTTTTLWDRLLIYSCLLNREIKMRNNFSKPTYRGHGWNSNYLFTRQGSVRTCGELLIPPPHYFLFPFLETLIASPLFCNPFLPSQLRAYLIFYACPFNFQLFLLPFPW